MTTGIRSYTPQDFIEKFKGETGGKLTISGLPREPRDPAPSEAYENPSGHGFICGAMPFQGFKKFEGKLMSIIFNNHRPTLVGTVKEIIMRGSFASDLDYGINEKGEKLYLPCSITLLTPEVEERGLKKTVEKTVHFSRGRTFWAKNNPLPTPDYVGDVLAIQVSGVVV